MDLENLQHALDQLADKPYEGKPLKEIFSYGGFSFWWRLKNILLEKRVRELTTAQLHYYLHAHYRMNQLKDLALGVARRKHPAARPLLLFSLTRLRPRYFAELENELIRQKQPYHFATYSPLVPSIHPPHEPAVCLESFFSLPLLREEARVRSAFKKKYQLLYNLLAPYHTDMYHLNLLCRFFLEKDIPEMFRLYRMAERMLVELKPKVILLTQENGKHSYPVMVAAHRAKIQVASLQHGFRALYPSYARSPSPTDRPKNTFDFHTPDYFFTYGEYDRRVLIRTGGYRPNRVFASGQPRYDALYEKLKTANLSYLRKKYGMPANKKILLWATQSHAWFNTSEVNEKNAKIVFEAITHLNDSWQLAIKLHQGEDQSAPIYKKFNKLHGNLAKIFDSRANTFDLLVASDAVVVTNSTVGTEAVLAGKPLLLIDSGKKADLSFYTTAGLGLLVENDAQLVGYLKKIKNYRKRFEKHRKTFLRENVSNFGFAASATVGYLKSILAKS